MYVCLCRPATEHDIRMAVHQGCHTLRALQARHGCCAQCRRCAGHARQLIRQTLREANRTPRGG